MPENTDSSPSSIVTKAHAASPVLDPPAKKAKHVHWDNAIRTKKEALEPLDEAVRAGDFGAFNTILEKLNKEEALWILRRGNGYFYYKLLNSAEDSVREDRYDREKFLQSIKLVLEIDENAPDKLHDLRRKDFIANGKVADNASRTIDQDYIPLEAEVRQKQIERLRRQLFGNHTERVLSVQEKCDKKIIENKALY